MWGHTLSVLSFTASQQQLRSISFLYSYISQFSLQIFTSDLFGYHFVYYVVYKSYLCGIFIASEWLENIVEDRAELFDYFMLILNERPNEIVGFFLWTLLTSF